MPAPLGLKLEQEVEQKRRFDAVRQPDQRGRVPRTYMMAPKTATATHPNARFVFAPDATEALACSARTMDVRDPGLPSWR